MLGRLIDGRYEVRERVASGGMATVYLALDKRLERRGLGSGQTVEEFDLLRRRGSSLGCDDREPRREPREYSPDTEVEHEFD